MNKIKGYILMFAGCISIVVALFLCYTTSDFIKNSATADAVVTDVNFGANHPRLEFSSSSGNKVSTSIGGFIKSYKVGDTARVVYDKNNPFRVYENSTLGLWTLPIIFGFLGLVGLITSVRGVRGNGA